MTRIRFGAPRAFGLVALVGLVVAALALAAPVEAQGRQYGARLRLGIQGDIGYVRQTDSGLILGLTGQLGVQQNDLFAVYYQPRLLAGTFLAGAREGAVLAGYNTLMFDFTLADIVQLGLGPSLDLGIVGVCRPNDCSGFGGAFFGADFKAAIALGARGPFGARSGFVIALHVHPTWIAAHESITTVTLGFGFQTY